MIAAVVLEHVNTPLSEAVGIIDFMVERSGYPTLSVLWPIAENRSSLTETSTSHLACTAVHAVFQSLVVEVI